MGVAGDKACLWQCGYRHSRSKACAQRSRWWGGGRLFATSVVSAKCTKLYTYPVSEASPAPLSSPSAKRQHLTRLLAIWRSDGWPCRDALEIELLVAGWVSVVNAAGHERLRLTDAGLALVAASRQRQQRALSTHDRLAQRVAEQLHDAGRVVWRELSLRARADAAPRDPSPTQALDLFAPPTVTAPDNAAGAPTEPESAAAGSVALAGRIYQGKTASFEPASGGWRMARPDVFSVRNTSVEAYLHPVVHEIKVSRADLFADLRHAAKRASYQWLCCECHYVFPAGMAQPEELPPELGVWVLHGDVDSGQLEVLRPARHQPCQLPFPVWLALAKATPWQPDRDPRQSHLGESPVTASDAEAGGGDDFFTGTGDRSPPG